MHLFKAVERLHGADQHGAGLPFSFGDHVKTKVHAVNKIHIGKPGRAEHWRVPFSLSAKRVAGGVIVQIGFGLYNFSAQWGRVSGGNHQRFSEQDVGNG